MVRLSHGNLVTVFDAGQVAGEIFIAMDFVEGKDLRAVWNRCAQKGVAFPVDIAVHIAKEMARGLALRARASGASSWSTATSRRPTCCSRTRRGEDHRLRAGLVDPEAGEDRPGHHLRQGQLHGARAGARRDARRPGRHLRRRHHPLGAAHRAAALPAGRPGAAPTTRCSEPVRHPHVLPPSQRASRVPKELERIVMKALAPDPTQRYQTARSCGPSWPPSRPGRRPAPTAHRSRPFLKDLFGEDIGSERREREDLLARGRVHAAGGSRPIRAPRCIAGLGPDPVQARAPSIRAEETGRDAARTRTMSGARARSPASDSAAVPDAVRRETREQSGEARRRRPRRRSSTSVIGTWSAAATACASCSARAAWARLRGRARRDRAGASRSRSCTRPTASTPDLVERFRREARAASKIGHPNIVDVTDSGTTTDGAFYFVMEFLEGVELGERDRPREARWTCARALHIGAQICRALAAAHDAGIIHRDLKPENVFLIDRDGQTDFVKVLDFGIAKSGSEARGDAQASAG